MEIPEKIYLTTDGDNSFVFTQKRSDNKGIEYVRKDAFIDKVCEWIKYNNENGGCLFDGWEENFKKYIEE